MSTFGIDYREYPDRLLSTCEPYANVWGWEHGSSGVTQFKARFQAINGNAHDKPAALRWAVRQTSWTYGGEFPNDATSYYDYLALYRGSLKLESNKLFTVRATIVGFRPSWWQADIVHYRYIGFCGYGDIRAEY